VGSSRNTAPPFRPAAAALALRNFETGAWRFTVVNLQFLIGKLNRTGRGATEAAAAISAARRNAEVEIEHLLVALLDCPESDVVRICSRSGVERGRLLADLSLAVDRMASINSGTSSLSPNLVRLLTAAWTRSSLEFGYTAIRTGTLMLALLDTSDLRESIGNISSEFRKLTAATMRSEWRELLNPAEDGSDSRSAETLGRFTTDLTRSAREGKIDPVIGREKEIRQVMDILTRRRQNNPILTGEAGVGKTAIVEGFALRVAMGDVPPALRDVSIFSLDLAVLQAGAAMRGEFEERLRAVIGGVAASRSLIILFIDEAHALIGGGGAGQGDAANLLKPAWARGELRTIAATTYSEYRKYFERDAALARRFQVVRVEEPDEATAICMVRGVAAMAERHHGVRVLNEAVESAVRLSHRYVSGRQLPDKAISVLDTACAWVALSQTTTPPALEDCQRHIERLEQEIASLRRETESGGVHAARLDGLFNSLAAAETRMADLEDRWREERRLVTQLTDLRHESETGSASEAVAAARVERDAARELAELQGESPLVRPFVDGGAVAEVISGWTGIPMGQMLRDELNTVVNLHSLLGARVLGQNAALETIARRIRTSRAGLEDPERPTGVFLLAGPSGVGKTETALALAEVLYGGERNAVVINMSEYQEAHSVSGLRGSPPGYVGYGEGGVLTEAVRRRPYCVLLLDEMEKAHPDVIELFYQVFDKGKMEDSQGREVDFRNTVILATSNVGSGTILKLCSRPGYMPTTAELQAALRPELRSTFQPALLGRMVVVPYSPIDRNTLRQIIGLKLDKIGKRLAEKYQINFEYSEDLLDHIAELSMEVESGARDVDQILTGTLLPEISRRLLSATGTKSSLRRIYCDAGAQTGIRYVHG
jgi:type VI secretion system protein VasG